MTFGDRHFVPRSCRKLLRVSTDLKALKIRLIRSTPRTERTISEANLRSIPFQRSHGCNLADLTA